MRIFILLLFSVFCVNSYGQITKKVLVEKFTSSNCGNCPDGTVRLKNITNDLDNIIWVSHHSGWIQDPLGFTEIHTIAEGLTEGAPRASIDRILWEGEPAIAVARSDWRPNIETVLAETADVEIELTGTYDATTRQVSVDINANFANVPTAGDFRMNVFVVQDSLYGPSQSNYFGGTEGHELYGTSNPIENYPHRHVTRAVLSAAWGDSDVIPNEPVTETDYNRLYTYTLPEDVVMEQTRIVAFVSYYGENAAEKQVLNANEQSINTMTGTTPVTIITKESLNVEVFPTLTNDYCYIATHSERESELTAQIYAVSGQLVKEWSSIKIQSGNTQHRLDVSNLPQGSYWIRFQDVESNKLITKKLMIL